MSSPAPSTRPSQVTVAGWSVAIASAFLLLSAFDALGSLHTVETRDQLTQAIDSGNLQGLGISVAEAVDAKRWALYVSAVAAVLTGILGVFVLRRDKAARIGISIGAVPIVLAVPLTGSFLAMLVGAGAAVLWTRPARDWFAGRAPTPREPKVQAPTEPPAWVPPVDVSGVSTRSTSGAPRPAPTPGWGVPPGHPPYAPPPVAPYPPVQAERPRQVRTACLITWIFSGITALGYVALLAAISIDQQGLIDMVKENPAWDASYDDDLIVTAAVAGSIVFLLWCALASVVAVFTWRGASWAWVVQLVSTGFAALVALLGLPFSLLHLVAIGAAFGLLLSRPSRDWFTSRRR